MPFELIFIITISMIYGIYALRLGWLYRTGKEKKYYFYADNKSPEHATLGIPIGVFFLSLFVGMLGLALNGIFVKIGMTILGFGFGLFIISFIFLFFRSSFIFPEWVRWLEKNHADVLPLLHREFQNSDLKVWSEKVQTQEGFEDWITNVRSKFRRDSNLANLL